MVNKKKIVGIKRKTQYSPNHIGNDGTIFTLTAQSLRNAGYEVYEYTEAEFVLGNIEADYIFHMARDKTTLRRLQKLEQKGTVVVNSSFGIDNCTRANMTRLLLDNQVFHPASIIVDVNDDPTEALLGMNARAYWVKRGDFHAVNQGDVTYARNIEEVKSILMEFAFRDIPNAVINEHLVGDLVKFYGVVDTDFFYWFYPYDLNHSKFGLESLNETIKEFLFDINLLKDTCRKACEVLNIKIYGGDCVVAADGSFKIIDFNDWPSYAPCRNEAAPYISDCIQKLFLK